MVPFVKTQALGNDFVLVEESHVPGRDYAALGRKICDRRSGVGGDGLIVWHAGSDAVRLRIINSDGSEAECSGNGLRCLAAYLFGNGAASGDAVRLRTASGVYTLRREGDRYAADMGRPELVPEKIPFRAVSAAEKVVDYPLQVDGRTVRISACATGNPHCTLFVDAIDAGEVHALGPLLERHPAFPNKTNVEFVHVRGRDAIDVAFWERGAGPTPASGTGSCGAVVASVLNGRTGRRVTVHTENGVLEVEWRNDDDRLRLVSTAEVVAEGGYHDA